ncbi:hypothetical protein Tco_1342377 [Tanacetum coccineum]
MLAEAQEAGQILDEEQVAFLADSGVPDGQAVQTIIPNNAAFQTEDLDTYDSDCDDISNAKAVLMANISNYGSELSQSDSNIIPYSQYLQETQLTTVQDTSLQAQQDSMILSVIEQMSEQMINHVNNWEKANKEQNNESVTAELERYKKRVKTFAQRLNIDLSSREKMIDSQMDDMIKEKLALKEQVDSLVQNFSKEIKEKECLLQTFIVLKNESKEKENKYTENEIDLEKRIKELDNIIFKVGQSAQTVHMLTKPQVFYDNIHKQALGYQNPFYLKKAQRIKPTLYDGIVMSDKHVAMLVIDDEETLILEEESGSKMSEKEKDPEAIKQNISHKLINYVHMSNPTSKSSDASLVKIEAPKELPKVSLVNESLKKLKFHLAKFDNVVKIRTTPNARTEDEWGFEHTKAIFNKEIIPFLKSLKDIFNSSVDKQCLEIANKELLFENDRLLQQIMSQDVLLTMMNYVSLIEYFKNNDLKAQLQDKDTTICKLKEIIKSMREKSKEENVNYDYCEIETKNVELENSVAKLLSKNECLCKQINYVKQAQIPSANTIVPGMFKLDLEPLAPRLLQNREAHIDYLKYTQEKADILREIELVVYVRDTCPIVIKLSAKKVPALPKNIVKFTQVESSKTSDSNTSLSNITQVESSKTSDSNTPVLSPTGLKCSTSNCGSKPTCNKKNDKISQTPSRNMNNKVEAQPRKVNKKNRVVEPIRDVDVKHSLLNANSTCATYKKSMFDDVHDMCILAFVKNVNSRAKSAKKHKKKIFGNLRVMITSANVVPPKKTTSHSVETQKPELKVYSRNPKNAKNVGSSKKAKIVESKNANHSEPNHTWVSNATDIPLSSSLIMTGCPDCSLFNSGTTILQGLWGMVTISRVYYVEGLGHKLFSIGQFYNADLEVAF